MSTSDDTKFASQHLDNRSFNENLSIYENLIYGYDGSNARSISVDSSGNINVNAGTTSYAIRLDDTSTSNVTYVGKAAIGSASSSAVWQIFKIDETSGMIITWADSDALFNNIWDNRTSLTYG